MINNPIAALEARELARAGGFSLAWPKRGWRARGVWLFRVIVLILCINYYAIHLAASLYPINLIPLQESIPGQVLRVGLIIIGLVELFLFLIRTLAISAASISREHQMGRWDLIQLTGMTSRKLSRGKRWALRENLRPSLVYITAVRTGMCLSLGYFLSFAFVNLGPGNQLYRPISINLVLLPLMLYFFTYGLTSLVIAIGLVHSAASQRPERALIRGVSTFLGVWAVLSLCILNTISQWSLASQGEDLDLAPICGVIFFSALDGGTLLSSLLNNYYSNSTYSSVTFTLTALMAGSAAAFLFYTISITTLNYIAEGILEKQGLARPIYWE
jgi:hypothetical protein